MMVHTKNTRPGVRIPGPKPSTGTDHKCDLSKVKTTCRSSECRNPIRFVTKGLGWLVTELLFSRSVMSNSLRLHGLQYAGLPVLYYLPEFAQTYLHWVNDATQPSVTPFSTCLNPSQHQGLFQWVHQVAKILELQLQNQSFQWILRTDIRTGWFDLLAVSGTRKSLLQHHSSKASILRHSAFFMAQLSHPYMTTGNTVALTISNFVGKVMSLLFHTLS